MGYVTRASLDKQPHEVAAMFDDVAARYDLTNDVLSLGQARLWRRAVARAVEARPGERVLDLAAGTGTSSLPFVMDGAYTVPCDFSPGMLTEGTPAQAGRLVEGGLAEPDRRRGGTAPGRTGLSPPATSRSGPSYGPHRLPMPIPQPLRESL